MKPPLRIVLMITGLASYPASRAAHDRLVYANNDPLPGNNASAFSVASTDGLVWQRSSTAIGKGPAGMKVSTDRKYLAVGLPGFGSGAVAMFSIGSNGALTMINGAPFADSGPGFLAGVDIDCASGHVFGGE